MLTQLEVFTPRVLVSPFALNQGGIKTDPIQIINIDGLEPVKANVNSTQYGSVNGEFYTGSSYGKRNIVITVKLNPDWVENTIESLRQILYSYFMPTNQVRLRFTSTHIEVVEIVGYVESIEPTIFSKDPTMQISIICPEPDFVAVNLTPYGGSTTGLNDSLPKTIDYKGSIPTGFYVLLTAPSGSSNFNGVIQITRKKPSYQYFAISGQIDQTHRVAIQTLKGVKYARNLILPSGNPINLLNTLKKGSVWPTLEPGINTVQIATATPNYVWGLNYYARYGGL